MVTPMLCRALLWAEFWQNGMTTCHLENDGTGSAQGLMWVAASQHETAQRASLQQWWGGGIRVALKPPAWNHDLQACPFLSKGCAANTVTVKSLLGWQIEEGKLLQARRAGQAGQCSLIYAHLLLNMKLTVSYILCQHLPGRELRRWLPLPSDTTSKHNPLVHPVEPRSLHITWHVLPAPEPFTVLCKQWPKPLPRKTQTSFFCISLVSYQGGEVTVHEAIIDSISIREASSWLSYLQLTRTQQREF